MLLNVIALFICLLILSTLTYGIVRSEKVVRFRLEILNEDLKSQSKAIDEGRWEDVRFEQYDKLPPYGCMVWSFKKINKENWL